MRRRNAKDPARIGPYTVVRPLGAGSMGRVYLATSAGARLVAVKVINPDIADDPAFRPLFKAQIEAARVVSGAYTAPVADADIDGTSPWLATAYIDAPTLQATVDRHGPLPEDELRVLGAGLAEALTAIHQAGLIHRDLKPSNILLATDGPRVIDFGISQPPGGLTRPSDDRFTGTAGYLAPEHAAECEMSEASDVFSLGAVLVFAATGSDPFGDGPPQVLIYRAANEPPQLDGVPPRLVGTVTACLDKDPERRPVTAELPVLLRAPASPSGPARDDALHRETLVPGRGRRVLSRRRALLVGGALLAAGAVAAEFWPGRGRQAVPGLLWSITVPRPGMFPQAFYPATVVIADASGAAGVDLTTGRVLWNDADSGDADLNSDAKRVYAIRADGQLHALDPRTGAALWKSSVADGYSLQFAGPQYARGPFEPATIIMHDSRPWYYNIDATTGKTRWTYRPASETFNIDCVTADGLVVGHDGSGYLAIGPDTGAVRWSGRGAMQGMYTSSADNLLYGLDSAMALIALRADTGDRVWSRPSSLPGSTAADIATYEGALVQYQDVLIVSPLMSPGSGVLAAFDAATGRKLWSLALPSAVDLGSYRVSGQILYYYLDAAIHAVDRRTGRNSWTVQATSKPSLLGSADGTLIFASLGGNDEGDIHALEAATGRPAWHYPIPASNDSTQPSHASLASGKIYATYAGKLHSLVPPKSTPATGPTRRGPPIASSAATARANGLDDTQIAVLPAQIIQLW